MQTSSQKMKTAPFLTITWQHAQGCCSSLQKTRYGLKLLRRSYREVGSGLAIKVAQAGWTELGCSPSSAGAIRSALLSPPQPVPWDGYDKSEVICCSFVPGRNLCKPRSRALRSVSGGWYPAYIMSRDIFVVGWPHYGVSLLAVGN